MADRVTGRVSWSTFGLPFWVLALTYIGHQVIRETGYALPRWIEFYLDDFICLPVVLTCTLFLMRLFYGPQSRFTKYHVGFTVLYFSAAFEFFFPRFMTRYTGDILDVVLYALGGWYFYRFLNK